MGLRCTGDGGLRECIRLKAFLQKLGIRTTLTEMGVSLEQEALGDVLKEIVTGPDMEHIPYPVTEEMIYLAMKQVEQL